MRTHKPLLFFLTLLTLLPSAGHAVALPEEEFLLGTVHRIVKETETSAYGQDHLTQTVVLQLKSHPNAPSEITIENGVLDDRADMKLREGERVLVRRLEYDGQIRYFIAEKYRLPALGWLMGIFVVMTFLFGGVMGLRSILGLLLSVAVLALYVVPSIADGQNPLFVSILGSFVIACTTLYLAHGVQARTTVALASTLLTLLIAIGLSVVFVSVGKLFGMGSEESMFLQTGVGSNLSLRGLLLGGMIIGCLGVLDDITTGQTAVVDEIRKANPSQSPRALLSAGFVVGREHIASLINTLALAYAGSSLPLLLLFQINESFPLWVTMNSEAIAEELVRTLVGSSALLFAVPISTVLAVYLLPLLPQSKSRGHVHVHGHVH
jgi:uncharacterized membrane protein